MRRTTHLALLTLVIAIAGHVVNVLTQEAKPTLPPLEVCEANNYKLRVATVRQQSEIARLNGEVADLQSRLLAIEATNEKTRLEDKYREMLKPETGTQFNWNTYRFEAPTNNPASPR